MRFGSVCSGIEAASVAWHGLGWESAFFSEIEPFPRAVLAHHYPTVPCHGDFTTIRGDEYGPVDLLVGGTPCQSFSVAGLRAGLADDRGNLALEFLRLADRARPRWLVWENVPGVLSSNGGRDFGSILGGMVELGYGFAYRVLDAQYFGVAQRRRRVFVVGHLGDWRRAAAVLFERAGMCGHPAPRRETGQRAAPCLAARTRGGGGLGTDAELDGALIPSTGDVSRCLNAGGMGRQDYETETLVAHALRGEGFDASEDGTLIAAIDGEFNAATEVMGAVTTGAAHYNRAPMVAHAFDARQSDVLQYGDRTDPLDTDGHSVAVAFAQNTRDEVREMPVVGALAAQPGMKQTSYVRADMQVRRLTPRECERLQGFSDGYTAIPWRGRPASECPDGPRYKALGNTMAVPVMRWIGERIAAVDQVG